MAVLKYSRQREAIKNYLMSTKVHPTADMVYGKIREEYPNISLGTVYRNLSLLVEIGEAVKVPSFDGCDHFDGDTSPHYHFLCTECGRIVDLDENMVTGLEEMNKKVNENFNGTIDGCAIHFFGKCPECTVKS
ncbi:MAG: transcriptional repressor [Thermoflexaceae bacterium]|nr:transcriptional repressor [Thermoflexaceae bacterium]